MDVTGNVIAERFASSYFEYDVDILIASCNSDVILTMPSIHAASHGWRSVIERTRHLMRYLCHLTEQIMPYVDEQEEKLRGSLVWGSPNLVIREQLRINPDGKVIEIHRELQERPTVQPKLVDRAAVAELRDQLIHHMSLIDSVDVVKGTVLHSGPRNGGASPRITFLSTPRGARSFPHVADKEDLSRVLAADHHVFPVADFSFCDLNKVEDLLTAIPRLGQRLPVQEVLREIIPTEATLMAAAAQLVHPKSSSQVAAEQDKGNRLVVKAKSRGGDAVAYEFDRTEQEQAAQARVKDRQMDGRRMNRGGPDDNHEKQCQRTRFRTHAIRLGANNLGLDIASKEGGANRAPLSTLTLPMALRRIIQDAVLTLTWIDFSDNHLTTIPDLSAFPISILNLQQNNICDIREVWKVRCLPLISLNLFGNPLDGIRNYKVRVLDILISSKPIHTVKPLEMKELPHRSMEVRKLDNVPLSRGDRTHLISHRMLERTSTRT